MVLFPSMVDLAVSAGRRIVVLPFYDDSGYVGPWELHKEVPGMLGDMLMDDYFYVVPIDTVMKSMEKPEKISVLSRFFGLFSNKRYDQKILTDLEIVSYGRDFDADYAITGIVEDFTFRRQGAGDVLIGGYKSYLAKVELSNVRILRIADGTSLGSVGGEAEKSERGLGIDLFGKPRKRDIELYSLDSLDFGSKRFLNTLLGIAAVEALNKVQKEIRAILTLPDTTWYAEKKFKVISIDGSIVNINAGLADGIKPGNQFRVFASESGVLVGKINVTEVWSDHLSKAEILEGKDTIRSGDVIMPDRGDDV